MNGQVEVTRSFPSHTFALSTLTVDDSPLASYDSSAAVTLWPGGGEDDGKPTAADEEIEEGVEERLENDFRRRYPLVS